MTEEEKKAINNLWSSATDVMFNVLYSQEEMQEDIKVALNLIQRQQAENEKKDKIIDEIQKEVRDHIGFKNRLKKDNIEPDMFNQGRFYVADEINNILKRK